VPEAAGSPAGMQTVAAIGRDGKPMTTRTHSEEQQLEKYYKYVC
jgi:hypothetical protein